MKMKKLFISLVLIVSCLCFVSCKDKSNNDTQTKLDPVVSVEVKVGECSAGDSLKNVEISLAAGSTAGTIVWKNQDYVLQLGNNTCYWEFTPDDANTYNSKEGSYDILIKVNPTVNVELKNETVVYDETTLEYLSNYLEYSASYNNEDIAGKIEWKDNSQIISSKAKNNCEWTFIPNESSLYNQVSGSIEIEVNTEEKQTIEKIEQGGNLKTSGYVAFDEFDYTGITLKLIYNAGKVEFITNLNASNLAISYPEYNNNLSNCFHKGDEWVKIQYGAYEYKVDIESVGYYRVALPVHKEILTYDGTEKTFNIVSDNNDEQKYYTKNTETAKGTEAGPYEVSVTIVEEYQDNCRWVGTEELTVKVTCTINEKELSPTIYNFYGEYDGDKHSARVECENAEKIYYSLTENFSEKNETQIEFINAGTYTCYYFIEAVKNYKNTTGTLTITINKQTPKMTLKNAYSLETGEIINYPLSCLKVEDKKGNGVSVTKDQFNFTYYKTYSGTDGSSNVLTSSTDGAIENGGAPSEKNDIEYIVIVNFLGNENFAGVSGETTLFIDSEDNGFFGDFAFVENAEYYNGQITANGQIVDYLIPLSTEECKNYLKFTKQNKNDEGLIVVSLSYRLDGGVGSHNGRLYYSSNSYRIELEDGKTNYVITLGSENDKKKVVINGKNLVEWTIPNYLGSYSAKTVSDDDYNNGKNDGQFTTIELYDNFGTIGVRVNVNIKYVESVVVTDDTAHYLWGGNAIVSVEVIEKKLSLVLTCFITNKSGLESSGFRKENAEFKIYWNLPEDGATNPTIDKFIFTNAGLENNFSGLITEYKKVEN